MNTDRDDEQGPAEEKPLTRSELLRLLRGDGELQRVLAEVIRALQNRRLVGGGP